MTTRDAMFETRAAAWKEYHLTMRPARDVFEAVRIPARAKLDARLRAIKRQRGPAVKANKAEAKAAESTVTP